MKRGRLFSELIRYKEKRVKIGSLKKFSRTLYPKVAIEILASEGDGKFIINRRSIIQFYKFGDDGIKITRSLNVPLTDRMWVIEKTHPQNWLVLSAQIENAIYGAYILILYSYKEHYWKTIAKYKAKRRIEILKRIGFGVILRPPRHEQKTYK